MIYCFLSTETIVAPQEGCQEKCLKDPFQTNKASMVKDGQTKTGKIHRSIF